MNEITLDRGSSILNITKWPSVLNIIVTVKMFYYILMNYN